MSNLYKQRYVVTEESSTRVINSNALVEEKLEALARQAQPDESGFVAGLNLEAVEVVPKEDTISAEELLAQRTAEAEEVLQSANSQAEAVLAEAKEQSEAIRQQAQEEGLAKGLQEGRQQAQKELDELRQQLEEEKSAMQASYQKQLEELEPQLVDVIAEVFEQVFHVQFDDKKEILIYLIQNTILGVEGAKEFLVKVGIEDFAFLDSHRSEITEKVGTSVKVEIMADASLKDGQCIIETDSGIFDCGRDVQLEKLTKALRSLSLRG